ncbi:hypothetical protein [Pseudonocardia humida]|uniref:Ig-like domain-containing protein n=1 Tax=Pseudonocardia humida TaxID=2800819 RepID=A0ABT1ADH5_9PSEU|nr:hypothetical protein [Pseudonocardia humida]MCO1661110.1 hypothetical protein [Pseudonocardia humida]
MASFGVVVRADSQGAGYGVGRCVAAGIFSCGGPEPSVAVLWTAQDATVLDAVAFDPGHEVHRYRIEVRDAGAGQPVVGGSARPVPPGRPSSEVALG